MKKSLFVSVALLALFSVLDTGCASKKSVGPQQEGCEVKTSLMVFPADQAQYDTSKSDRRLQPDPTTRESPPANSADSVLAAKPVEAYPVQRYVDPADPNVMHERHVVYRRMPSTWKLQAAPSQQVIVGPVVNSTQGQSPIYSQEATSFLREQQVINESNRRAVEALLGATRGLQDEAIRRHNAEVQAKKDEASAELVRKEKEKAAQADADVKAKQEAPQQEQVPTVKRGAR